MARKVCTRGCLWLRKPPEEKALYVHPRKIREISSHLYACVLTKVMSLHLYALFPASHHLQQSILISLHIVPKVVGQIESLLGSFNLTSDDYSYFVLTLHACSGSCCSRTCVHAELRTCRLTHARPARRIVLEGCVSDSIGVDCSPRDFIKGGTCP